MHTYTLRTGANPGEQKLIKDGTEAFCPRLQPGIIPKQFGGGVDMFRIPCSSVCPFAEILTMDDKTYYKLSCETHVVQVLISKPVEKPNGVGNAIPGNFR